MQTLKQILGWEERRGVLLNLCFSLTLVIALFTVAVGLHLEFTSPDSLHAEGVAAADLQVP